MKDDIEHSSLPSSALEAAHSDDVIYSVSELNALTRQVIEGRLPVVWVEGEISNLACPPSGHFYFTLKDSQAQVRSVWFRMYQNQLRNIIKDGMQIMVRGKPSFYTARGDYQLLVERVELAGEGALKQAFEWLKKKLAQEGLFDARFKKPIPKLPTRIGIITSSTGAAVHDILTVLQKRFPLIPVLIYPTQVQGDTAPKQIIRALQVANARKECDVLLLARGGGSYEDLAAFNDETLARAIFASVIPVISAIGHEIDFTIADFVADLRAPTPSAAASACVPDIREWLIHTQHLVRQLKLQVLQQIRTKHHQLIQHEKKLKHPGMIIFEWLQRFDDYQQKLHHHIHRKLHQQQLKYNELRIKMLHLSRYIRIEQKQSEVVEYLQRLHQRSHLKLQLATAQFKRLIQVLDALSPLKILQRGYAIVVDEQGTVITSGQKLRQNDSLMIEFEKDKIRCQVKEVLPQ